VSDRGRRISPLVAGLIAGAVIAVIVGIMAKINLDFAAPWASTHSLSMRVVDADGIGVSSDVRIAGRLVGQVTDVTSNGDYSTVSFHVDGSEWPLAGDTTASIRLATLLGQKYVELQPGQDRSHPLADSAVIGLQRTKPVVDFDQILDTFNKPTRTALTNLIKTVGGAVKGQEGTLQQLLPSLNDLSKHSVTPTGELVKRDPELNSILVNLGVTADQFNRSRNDLAGVIDNLNSVTGALASHSDALRGFIRNVDTWNQTTNLVLGNGGAEQFNAGLQRLDTLATEVNTTFRHLIPQSKVFSQTKFYNGKTPLDSAINLIYEISDAASQGDAYGQFLRQWANSLDFSGLVPPGTSGRTQSSGTNSTPPLHGLPLPTLPLPTLPLPTPTLPGLNGGTGLLGTGIHLSSYSDSWLADYAAGGYA
jgi:phospholipid/cholesterol/gamma-HCH transport system substrate-binding protein